MQLWKQSLLRTYVEASMPYRMIANSLAARRGCAPIVILFYHRVADTRITPWTMSRAMFRRQIDWLQDRFDMVSLSDAQQRIRANKNPRPAVCITFDDGYGDNCDFALPLLTERGIPCTYFVSTGHVVEGKPFPHDLKLGTELPPNTIAQLKEAVQAGVEIGGHTRTHADLGVQRTPRQLFDEVIASIHDLEALVDQPIRYFAFPFGQHANLSADVFQLAKRNGLAGVCSAYGGYNFPGDDPFHLQRIHADSEFARFKNWLTLDPLKRRAERFEYSISRQHSTKGELSLQKEPLMGR